MKPKQLTDWYAHPKYYEAIFGADSQREIDFLLETNERYGTRGRRWLEPACGAGRLLQEGARRGLRLTGYDASTAMLDHARARLSPGELRRVQIHPGSMEAFCPRALHGRFDLAFNLVSTFRYLPDERAATDHLRCVRMMLKPDGIYVLGFHLTDYERTRPEHERWVGRVGNERVVCNTHEWPPNRAERFSAMRNRLDIRGPRRRWRIETRWRFRTYDDQQARALFRRVGFQVVALFDFDYEINAPLSWSTDRLDRVFILSAGSD